MFRNVILERANSILPMLLLSVIIIIPFIYGAINSYENKVAMEKEFGESYIVLQSDKGRFLVFVINETTPDNKEAYWFSFSDNHEIINKKILSQIEVEEILSEIRAGNINNWSESG